MELDSYVQQIVLPYFNSFVREDVDMGLFSPSGLILGCTLKGAQVYGLQIEDVLGISYKDLDSEMIEKICRKTQIANSKHFFSLFQTLAKLNDIVVQEKRIINYIDILPYVNQYSASLVTHIPIFNPHTGEVVATQTIGSDFHLFGMSDYINNLRKDPQLTPLSISLPQNILNLKLPQRQHEILFLLLIGLSQSEIATVLGITRGTVSSNITNHLYKKFKVNSQNTYELLNIARKLHFHKYIPPSLCEPKIIIIDSYIKDKYF